MTGTFGLKGPWCAGKRAARVELSFAAERWLCGLNSGGIALVPSAPCSSQNGIVALLDGLIGLSSAY